MLSPEAIVEAIPHALNTLEIPGGLPSGKVRDFYVYGGGKRRVLITTDRLVIFDHLLGLIPYKGQVLNQLAAWWFEHTADIIPNHFLEMPDPNVTVAREARPILLAVVVRGYITGITPTSLWTRYAAGERQIYGMNFPEGLKKNQALPEPVVTPTTKSTAGHDDRMALHDVVKEKYIDLQTWERIQDTALALYLRGVEIAKQSGLILVDSKYEFGFDEETGALILIDELHTPDSSRYWTADSYAKRLQDSEPENFDKELVRLWYVRQNSAPAQAMTQDLVVTISQRYQQVFEMITGHPFEPASYPAEERIQAALAEYA